MVLRLDHYIVLGTDVRFGLQLQLAPPFGYMRIFSSSESENGATIESASLEKARTTLQEVFLLCLYTLIAWARQTPNLCCRGEDEPT